MAFWGIEVKPGKPVTHSFDKVRRRLRISQATLGIGSVMKKTIVQCNVGNKSPVFLCALLPDKTESCHLDLEFEEPQDVVFSVIGPRNVYLTGYYLSNSHHPVSGSDTETWGEDIANTETEESGHHTDEDKYEDSFIDDDDDELKVFPPSPYSSCQDDEEMLGKSKMKEGKAISKLQRKRVQVIDSDHDSASQESEDEDNFILSVFKSKNAAKTTISEVEQKNCKGTTETAGTKANCDTSDSSNEKPDGLMMCREAKRKDLPDNEFKLEEDIELKESWKHLGKEAETLEDDFINHRDGLVDTKSQEENGKVYSSENLVPSNQDQSEPDPVRKKKSKRKRKEQSEEVKSLGGGSGDCGKALEEDKALQLEAETDGKPQDLIQSDKDMQKPTSIGNAIGSIILLPAEQSSENEQNPKKRRKAGTRERSVRSDDKTCGSISVEDHFKQSVPGVSKMNKDLPAPAEEYKTDRASDPVAEVCKRENPKKKKKKSKALETDANYSNNASISSENENKKSPLKLEERNCENGTSQGRTLSNGLTIQELASCKNDGKIATLGRKVKVFYTAKLKGSEHIFDSNIGRSPYKFRLGDETVIEGLNVGLQGMRVGEKRRLIVPPSMGFGHQGAGENIPPNSWLVYEVELASAR